MPSVTPESEYRQRLARRNTEIAELARKDNLIGYVRLGVALGGVFLFWLVFVHHSGHPLWMLAPIAGFAALVVMHQRILRGLHTARAAAAFCERGLARLDGTWPGQGEDGARFGIADHPYADSLDLFGRGSLFQLLCTARTHSGEECLARWLLAPAEPGVIASRQGAIAELRGQLDLREDLALLGETVRSGIHPDHLARWAAAPALLQRRWYRVAAFVLPTFLLAGAVVWSVWDMRIPFLLAFLVQAGFGFHVRPLVNESAEGLDEPAHELGLIAELLERIEKEEYQSAHLQSLLSALASEGLPPSRQIARLARLFNQLESRHNQFFAPIAAMLLWGTHHTIAIEKWRLAHGPFIGRWIEALGEFEALNSLAGYAYEHPADPFPQVVEGPALFDGTRLAHPLLPVSRAVANSIRLGAEQPLVIISGSNMSGKSTMLRTIGVNTVLAMAGAPVRGGALTLSRLTLGASIRIVDSLQEGRSRFFAEITRLEKLVELTGGEAPLLFLLDELLSGTNSHDRRIGATAVVQGLLKRAAVGVITTHDLALTQMEGLNLHFEDHFEDGRITFDYQIRPGVVTKSNALELMRSIGLDV
ncbi:MAG TPA: hypothetical protein VGK29_07355 [Paludibaculum sp.]|jgi:hypothetical protein